MEPHVWIIIVNRMHKIHGSKKNDKESKGPTGFIFFRAWLAQLFIRIQFLRRLPRRGIRHGVSMACHRKCIGWMWRCGVSIVNGSHFKRRYGQGPSRSTSHGGRCTHSPSGKRPFFVAWVWNNLILEHYAPVQNNASSVYNCNRS